MDIILKWCSLTNGSQDVGMVTFSPPFQGTLKTPGIICGSLSHTYTSALISGLSREVVVVSAVGEAWPWLVSPINPQRPDGRSSPPLPFPHSTTQPI